MCIKSDCRNFGQKEDKKKRVQLLSQKQFIFINSSWKWLFFVFQFSKNILFLCHPPKFHIFHQFCIFSTTKKFFLTNYSKKCLLTKMYIFIIVKTAIRVITHYDGLVRANPKGPNPTQTKIPTPTLIIHNHLPAISIFPYNKICESTRLSPLSNTLWLYIYIYIVTCLLV